LKKNLIRKSRIEQHYTLDIADDNIIKALDHKKIFTLSSKLPMIVEPKPYSNNALGGYVLNDVEFKEEIIIEKKGYKFTSKLKNVNLVT
jgi:DNA-directed RNA polymerase